MAYEYKKLQEVAEILDNKRKPVSDKERQKMIGEIPYYGANGQVGWINNYIFDEKLILLAEDGGNYLDPFKPNAYTIEGKAWVNNHAHVLKNKSEIIDFDWLFYVLAWTDIRNYVSGTTRLKLNQARMREIPIPVPSLSEQKQIVSKIKECFKDIAKAEDRLIKTEKKAQKLLDSVLKKALMVKRLESYELKDLAELINGDRGKNYPNKSALVKEGVPFITAGHIQDHKVDFSQMNYITEERYNILNNGKIKKDDIIFCLRGSLGKIALIDFNQNGAIGSSLVIIRPNSRITSKYLYYYLLSQYGQSQIRLFDNGTAQPNLSAANLNKFIIKLPDNETQKRIVTQIEESAIKISNINKVISKQILNLEKMRQSILKKAFEGKLI